MLKPKSLLLTFFQQKTLSIIFCFLMGTPLYSQQLANKAITVGRFTRSYHYLADDLGYFVHLQGDQHCFDKYGYFNITCEKGKPVSFFFNSERIPVAATNTNILVELSSRGLYDDHYGICAVSSYCSNAHLERAFSAYRLGDVIDFAGKLIIDRDSIVQYGWINIADYYKQLIISFDNAEHKTRDMKSDGYRFYNNFDPSVSILYNNNFYLFEDKKIMEGFLACRNDEEVYRKYYVLEEKVYNKDIILEVPWAPGFTRWNQYAGFTDCEKKIRIPKKYFYYPIGKGKDDELHYLGLNYDSRNAGEKVYIVQKRGERQPIKYLTNEQYEKYKDRIEYNSKEQRHGVKTANGSYLYVPEEIEVGIRKTPSEIQQDNITIRPYQLAFDAIRETNKFLENNEVNLDFVFTSDKKEAFFKSVEKFERDYDIALKSTERDLESEIVRDIEDDCLMGDDYAYILKDAGSYNNESLNVIAAILAAKENNQELAFKCISKVNNFEPATFIESKSNNEWSFMWDQTTLVSSNSCPAGHSMDNVLLLCCALLDKKGDSINSFKICNKKVLFEAVEENWDYYSTCPGIVVNAILNKKKEVVSNHSFLVSFLESLDPKKYEEHVKLLNEGWHTITANSSAPDNTDPNIRSLFSIIQYSAGFIYMKAGQYDSAINCFLTCFKYADYKERIKECKTSMKKHSR